MTIGQLLRFTADRFTKQQLNQQTKQQADQQRPAA
jgi:hypothetical protein